MIDPLDDEALDRAFRTARTFNHYTDEPVADETLHRLYDLMKWGPTSANQQPLRIVWCMSDEAKGRLAGFASGQNAPKIRAAPVTAILGMDLEFYELMPRFYPHVDARAWFVGNESLIRESAFRNSTLQGGYFIIAARMIGLDVGPMSGFDNAKVDEAFFAGMPVKSNFIATLGHGDRATLRPQLERMAFEEATRFA